MSIGLLVISFLLVLGPLILLHELGHFLVAKRAGIRALEFGMGYPPRAARLWRGKGYIIVSGRRIEIPRNFNLPFDWQIGINKRAEASADEIKGRLVLRSIELADGEDKSLQPEQLPAPIPQAMVDGHAVEMSRNAVAVRPAPKPAVKAAPRRGAIALSGVIEEIDPGTEYTLNWLPLGGFVRMWGEEGATGKGSFTDAPKRWRTATLLAGPGMNILVALIVFTGMYMIGYPEFPNVPAKITDVMTGSPAASAGLQVNDTIIALDDTPIKDASDVRPYIEEHGGQPVKVTVMRAGQHIVLSITPRTAAQTPPNQGRMGIVLSTAPLSNYTLVKYPPGEAVARAFGDISNTLRQIVTLPTRLLSGVIAPSEAQVVGPVGISEYAAAAVQKTTTTGEWFWFLNLFAAISLALAITNLLPLPALDGGRLLFVILEAIRHKRIAPEREAVVHLIGMAVLLALMALITFQDISRLISN